MRILSIKPLHPVIFAGVLALHGSTASADVITYSQISEPIVSASFSADFAALTAHRTVAGVEVNSVRLSDISGGLGLLDLSDILFGSADAFSDPAALDQGLFETGIAIAPIDPSFFPALASGQVRLHATFTDTFDALFAIDFLSLTILTATGTTVATIDSNNGFGIGIPDGGSLSARLPLSIPIGATGTGFDEALSSKTINGVIPEPSTIVLVGSSLALLALRRRRAGVRERPDRG